jgi:hypothetical protein
MPAPSIGALYDFETQFDTALTALLTAILGPQCPVFTAFEKEKLKVPGVQAMFTLGGYYKAASQTGSGHPAKATQPAMVDYWTGSFRFTAYGRREAGKSPDPYIAAIRGNLEQRAAASPNLNTFLDYVQVQGLDHESSQRLILEDKTDASQTTYSVVFGVLQSAYPTP